MYLLIITKYYVTKEKCVYVSASVCVSREGAGQWGEWEKKCIVKVLFTAFVYGPIAAISSSAGIIFVTTSNKIVSFSASEYVRRAEQRVYIIRFLLWTLG